MKRSWISLWILGALLFVSLSSVAVAGGLDGKEINTILYGEAGDVEAAIGRLREAGPAGLEGLLERRRKRFKSRHSRRPPPTCRRIFRLYSPGLTTPSTGLAGRSTAPLRGFIGTPIWSRRKRWLSRAASRF